MKRIVQVTMLAGLLATADVGPGFPSHAVLGAQADTGVGQDPIPWAADYAAACDQAAQQGKLVLLHFYSDECAPCERVERNVFSQASVAAAIDRNYVPVKVHARQHPELAQRYQIQRWPTDVAVTPAGLEVHRATSPQLPEQYVELVDLMAQKAGVGTGRQWAANMQQAGQATLAQSRATAQGFVAQGQQNLQQSTQQWSQQAQDAAQQFNQQTQTAVNQYQQQASGAVQQWNEQAGSAVQQYREQAQNTAQQWNDKVAAAGQQLQQQSQAAGQQVQAAGQQVQAAGQQMQATAQQFAGAARDPRAQWQVGMTPSDPHGPQISPPVVGAIPPLQSAITQNPWVSNRPAAAPANAAPPYESPAPQFVQHNAAPSAPPSDERQLVPASQAPPTLLDGYCAVTLIETMKWKKADPQFGAIHRGRTYLFANAQQQKKFLANPDAYAPVLSGFDPVRFATTGQLVEGQRAYGVVMPDKRIFLFADEQSLQQFEQSPRAFAETAYQAMQRSETGTTYR